VAFTQPYVGFSHAILIPSAFLVVGIGASTGLPMGPRLRIVADCIASGAVPVRMAGFIAARPLLAVIHPPLFLPRHEAATPRSPEA
jgi:hypothetical protein